jgi:predicted transcriptional regulator of viral defense system
MKTNGVGKYEDDLYEIQFEANNCETQEEAMLLLHRINSRVAVIADYIHTECETEREKKRWYKLLNEYNKLRGTLSKQKIYQNKTRLYVNYGYDD